MINDAHRRDLVGEPSPRALATVVRRAVLLADATLLAVGLQIGSAAADPAPPPVVVGSSGANGFITVTATSPGSAGSSGRDAAPPPGGATGGGPPEAGGPGPATGASPSQGSSTSAGNTAISSGPTLDGYGSSMCGASSGMASLCSGVLSGGGASVANPMGFLNASGQALCGLGSTYACPAPSSSAAPAAAAGAPAAPPPPAPPPSPAVVAQVAISQLDLTAATPHLSANPNTAVGLPVWMWVDPGPNTTGPLSTTAAAGPTVVTATATLARIDWSMGPPGVVVACAGPGIPPPPGPLFAGDDSPDCGYSYALRSLPERTGGTGKWPVTATSVWNIGWVGGGQAGQQTLQLTATTSVEVGELQAVVVGRS